MHNRNGAHFNSYGVRFSIVNRIVHLHHNKLPKSTILIVVWTLIYPHDKKVDFSWTDLQKQIKTNKNRKCSIITDICREKAIHAVWELERFLFIGFINKND